MGRSTLLRGCSVSSAAVAAVALLMFACKEPSGTNPAKGLSLSATGKTVDFGTDEASVTIVASTDWTLAVAADSRWITPSASSGSAGSTTTVKFTLTPNPGDKARVGTVDINAAGESNSYKFTITQNGKNTLSGVNKWIRDELAGWYYWNDEVKKLGETKFPSGSLEYEAFLDGLIGALPWASVQDTSNGEDPPTIDGAYAFEDDGSLSKPLQRDHIYSYIDRFPAGTRADESSEVTFGFDITPFRNGGTDNNPKIVFMVIWVMPDSPADKAGLKRGMWIKKYNGADITMDRYEAFWYQLYDLEGGNTMSLTDEGDKDYSLTAVEMKASPILKNDVLTTRGGKKTAYLMYNEFKNGEKGEFDTALRGVFGEFKKAGATELVLDLRYNPGGYVSSCQTLTSLAGDVGTSNVFAKLMRNKEIKAVANVDNPEVLHFVNETNSLKLRKIYVLATGDSASASEMVINALRGANVEVVHIGTRTNGKNVGMDQRATSINSYRYEMWPITFKILNAKDFTDYAGGFQPDYRKEDLYDVTAGRPGASDEIHELGDPQERLLKTALDLIDGKSVTPDPLPARSRADGRESGIRPMPSLKDPRRGGAKYVPDTDTQQ